MVYVNTAMQTHPVSPLLDGDPRDVHVFSGDRYTKTYKSIVCLFVFSGKIETAKVWVIMRKINCKY